MAVFLFPRRELSLGGGLDGSLGFFPVKDSRRGLGCFGDFPLPTGDNLSPLLPSGVRGERDALLPKDDDKFDPLDFKFKESEGDGFPWFR